MIYVSLSDNQRVEAGKVSKTKKNSYSLEYSDEKEMIKSLPKDLMKAYNEDNSIKLFKFKHLLNIKTYKNILKEVNFKYSTLYVNRVIKENYSIITMQLNIYNEDIVTYSFYETVPNNIDLNNIIQLMALKILIKYNLEYFNSIILCFPYNYDFNVLNKGIKRFKFNEDNVEDLGKGQLLEFALKIENPHMLNGYIKGVI